MSSVWSKIECLSQVSYSLQEVFEILRASFDEAHKVIMDREGGLTTLCACLVCPVKNSSQFAMCCLNVGDSYGYVFSHNQGKATIRKLWAGLFKA